MAVLSIEEIREKVNSSKEYEFLKTNPNLGNHLMLLGLGGSYAYGMANENSDIDIRGIALNSKEEILLGTDFEEVVEKETDTTVYSLKKMCRLLCANNPNTIEILGLTKDQIVQKSPLVDELYKLTPAFLSKRCIKTFGGYANSQLRRLFNKAAREMDEEIREKNTIKSIESAQNYFQDRYEHIEKGLVKLYVDDAVREGHESEIFIDGKEFKHYPLREYWKYINEFGAIVRTYDKVDSSRNRKAAEKGKLAKHMAHLLRLYYMCFDILNEGIVRTYREEEHDLLMAVRNGEFLDKNKQPVEDFYKIVDELEDKLHTYARNTKLQEEADYDRVNKWLCSVHERVVNLY